MPKIEFFLSSEGSILEFQIFPGIFPEAVELANDDNKEFLDLTVHGYLLYNTVEWSELTNPTETPPQNLLMVNPINVCYKEILI